MTDLIGQAPAAAAPRRGRRRWAIFLLVAVMLLGLAAGLAVWVARPPPPVLRPVGLVAGPSTANSIAFDWSRPPTGPLPDKYLILGAGTTAGSVAGSVTSFRQAGLTPASTYEYRIVAVRGSKRSAQSALLTLHTLTPPLSQARLRGSWSIYAKTVGPAPSGRRSGYMTWHLSPVCAVGACDVTLHGKNGRYSFSGKLSRVGAAYTGRILTRFACGPRASSVPDPVTLTIKVHATKAIGERQMWAATSLAGTIVIAFQYVSTATFYCSASTVQGVLTGTPIYS